MRYSTEHGSRSLFVSQDVSALRKLHPDNPRLQQLSDDRPRDRLRAARGPAGRVARGARVDRARDRGGRRRAAAVRSQVALIDVDTTSFLVITIVAATAALTVAVLPPRLCPPVVVIELLLGIVIGPQVLDLAQSDDFTAFFGNLGLGLLFFFAGYEIDFGKVRGRPLGLAVAGWLMSLAIAYGLGERLPPPASCSRSSIPARRSRPPRSAR